MRIIGRRRIAAVAAAAVLGIVGPVTSASASGNVLYASQGNEAHTCTVLGTDGAGRKGVLCVDVLTDTVFGAPRATGQTEILCETSSGTVVQCADAYLQNSQFANALNGVQGSRYYWECGHANPTACATGRNYYKFGTFTTDPNGCGTNLLDNVWTVVAAAGVELPGSGKWVYLGSSNANDGGSESTGHWVVCQ